MLTSGARIRQASRIRKSCSSRALCGAGKSNSFPCSLDGRQGSKFMSTRATACNSTARSGPIKAVCGSTLPSILSVIKFLGLEQILKNSLTGLPIGGAKRRLRLSTRKGNRTVRNHDVLPKLHDGALSPYRCGYGRIPAGDIGVGGREIGYLFGQYKRIRDEHTGVLTGRGLSYGGSLIRKEATGYGLVYITEEAMRLRGDSFERQRPSSSRAAATWRFMRAKKPSPWAPRSWQCTIPTVICLRRKTGYEYQTLMRQIKEEERGRIKEYAERGCPVPFIPSGCKGIWCIPCDVALTVRHAERDRRGGCAETSRQKRRKIRC